MTAPQEGEDLVTEALNLMQRMTEATERAIELLEQLLRIYERQVHR